MIAKSLHESKLHYLLKDCFRITSICGISQGLKWNITNMQDYGLPRKPKGFLAMTKQNYRLPRIANDSRNDKVADALDSCHCEAHKVQRSAHCETVCPHLQIHNPKSRL